MIVEDCISIFSLCSESDKKLERDFRAVEDLLKKNGTMVRVNNLWAEVILQLEKVETTGGSRTNEQNWRAYILMKKCANYTITNGTRKNGNGGKVAFNQNGNIQAVADVLNAFPAKRQGE